MTPQTEVTLDAVMLKAEGKRGKLRSQKQSRHSSSLSQMQLSQMMHSQSPVHNKSPPLFDHISQKFPPRWHMHTSSLNRPKAPPEADTPPEQMLCNECNAGGVSESIQGYKDMSNN